MVNIDGFNPYAAAASGSEEIWKILKKEEKKGKTSKILSAIKSFHLAHQQVKEEIADVLSQEIGEPVKTDSPMVKNALFGLSLNKIFEKNENGEEVLSPDLKTMLQKYDSESAEARDAVSNKLSQGSKQKVPNNEQIIGMDLDEISLRSAEDPNLLLS